MTNSLQQNSEQENSKVDNKDLIHSSVSSLGYERKFVSFLFLHFFFRLINLPYEIRFS